MERPTAPWLTSPGSRQSWFRDQLSGGKHHTAEASARGGSGVLAGRCVRYPPHSTPLLLPDGIVLPNCPTAGLSATLSATWKAAEDDCLERRNSIRPCVPSHVAYKAERGGNELFRSPWKNVSTLARAAPKPRGNGVSASIRWRRA